MGVVYLGETMLDKGDIQQIEQVVSGTVQPMISQLRVEIGEVIEDIVLPAIDDAKQELRQEINETAKEIRQEIRVEAARTRDYVDEKLMDLKGDLIVLMRKEDVKVIRLVEILRNKHVLDEGEVAELIGMEPFPKTRLAPSV